MIFQRDRHAPSRSFDSAGNLRVQRTPSRSYDDVEAADGGGGGSIDTIERALETYDPSRDEGSLARRARELGLRGAHNKANTGSPVAGGSVCTRTTQPRVSTRAPPPSSPPFLTLPTFPTRPPTPSSRRSRRQQEHRLGAEQLDASWVGYGREPLL
mmetsp:Transcript_71438/g.201554  ORF Transcript_71438/g.201554 Transcript_71438/m.201554 type:complete len:156 (+) Transcript_71438:105-572(+)